MQPPSNFGFEQIVTEQIRGLLDTVAERPELSRERRGALTQTVICTVMAHNPRDPVETMLAAQTIVYDHMLRDGARDMLRGQDEPLKIKARPGILACGKMFLATVEALGRMRGRPEKSLTFARALPEDGMKPQAERKEEAATGQADAATGQADAAPGPEARPVQRPEPVVRAAARGEATAARTQPAAAAHDYGARAAAPAPVRAPASDPAAAGALPVSAPGPDSGRTGPSPAGEESLAPPPLSLAEMEALLFKGVDPLLRQKLLEAAARGGQNSADRADPIERQAAPA